MRSLLATLLSTALLASPTRAELRPASRGGLGADLPAARAEAGSLQVPDSGLPASGGRLFAEPVLNAAPGGSELPHSSIQRAVEPSAPNLNPALFSSGGNSSDGVREEYRHFLIRLGFEPYRERIAAALEKTDLAPAQRKVLQSSQRRLEALEAARELAAGLMSALAEQDYEAGALDRALDFTTRMAALNPLGAPKSLPPDIAQGSARDIFHWLDHETARRIESQTAAVTSDALRAAYGSRKLEQRLNSSPQESHALARETAAVKKQVEAALRSRYTDVEMGQTRFMPRALIACLVRYARQSGKGEIERELAARLESRGLRMSDFVGDRVDLLDRDGRERSFQIRTGDILGSRYRSRRASLIVSSARPHWTLWLKAFQQKLLGNPLGIWMKPLSNEPEVRSGRPLLNALKRALHALRTRLAFQPWLLRGYAHVGIAWVREADGVSMAWAWENEVDSQAGGMRLVGLADEFIKLGHHALFGVARWDPVKTLREFQDQALRRGDRAAARIPESEAPRFLRELHERVLRRIESFMADQGVAYDSDLSGRPFFESCISTIRSGFLQGGPFEFQRKFDHWDFLAKALRALGLAYRGLDMKKRALWLGSLFVDPKVFLHEKAELPDKEQVYHGGDPYTMRLYEEGDPALTASLRALLAREGLEDFAPDRDKLARALRVNLLGRRLRRRGGNWRHAFSLAVGYCAGLERLFRAAPELHPRAKMPGT